MPAVERVFVDNNIVLYALDADQQKHETAWNLLFTKPYISLQVINECSNVLNRKRQWPTEDVAQTMERVFQFVTVEPTDIATVRSAWKFQARYRFSYFDSLIIAAALAADCSTLYSEDMQHGQVIAGRLTINNPFLADSIL
ncbi:MAG: PIN domain-containing protein [Methylococcales bacterium]|nr:PIN domain-containing protein [Methylococcales bacterium]